MLLIKKLSVLIIVLSFTAGAWAQSKEVIQMGILLDTSSSMDGLIDQAKTNLWKIVNEMARAKKNGVSPKLQVALFEYGNDNLPASEGYIRQIVPLTDDLDKVSEALFKLTTNGGSEYCGMVIDKATKTLGWNKSNDIYKVIYIAGNEPFNQGDVDYLKSVKNTIGKGIIVNTIYCGDNASGISELWKDAADRGDGNYISIDQNAVAVDIKAPQDAEILKLNEQLNSTYIGYGASGIKRKELQAEQDTNSASMANEAAVQRAFAKAAPQYSNSSWDMVDASKNDSEMIKKIDKDDLPAEMQKMDDKEKIAYVEKKRKEREEIQAKLQKLSEARQKFVDAEIKKNAGTNTLDSAIVETIRKQAKIKGYSFE